MVRSEKCYTKYTRKHLIIYKKKAIQNVKSYLVVQKKSKSYDPNPILSNNKEHLIFIWNFKNQERKFFCRKDDCRIKLKLLYVFRCYYGII